MPNAADFLPRPKRIPSTSSFSQLWMFGVCPRKWAYRYINRERDYMSEQAKFGKAMDAAFEFLYREARTGPVPKLDDIVGAFLEADPSQITRAPHAKELFRLYDKDGHLLVRDPETALLQAHVSLLLHPVSTRIRGYIDLLHHGPKAAPVDGVVADLKCPKAAPTQLRADQSVQLTLYSVAAGVTTAELIGLTIKKPKSRKGFMAVVTPVKTEITPERVQRHALYLNGLEEGLNSCLQTGVWPRREPGGLCNQCSFFRACYLIDKPIRHVTPNGIIDEDVA